jgi:site-specific DNA-methyltransferase (adenine-specific)
MKSTKYKKKLLVGNCLDTLKQLDNDSIDSVVTDPPYELGFMGKSWDSTGIAFNVDIWQECLRVLKPGGHLIAFSGSRTYHRMAVAIEDAGFEIRDQIMYVYGSGFPKSLDVSKAIDKAAKAERKVIGKGINAPNLRDVGAKSKASIGIDKLSFGQVTNAERLTTDITAPATKEAKQWQGWGTALKPAHEPMVLARKPLSEKTVAANVLQHGTGAINIDASRVGFVSDADKKESTDKNQHADFGTKPITNNTVYGDYSMIEPKNYQPTGRFPANLIHDGSDEVVALFPNTGKGNNGKPFNYSGTEYNNKDTSLFNGDKPEAPSNYNDNGTAARFFYCAKASKSERNAGLDGLKKKSVAEWPQSLDGNDKRGAKPSSNFHPTVKPLTLIRYLIKLVTPPNGTVLDPFLGSGTTAVAATLDNFNWVGCEMTDDYLPIIKGRVDWATKENKKAKQQELDLHENN